MSSEEANPRPRPLTLLVGLAAVLFFFAAIDALTPKANAQEDADDGAKTTATAPTRAPTQNIFLHILKSVGWTFGFVLLVISIGLVTLVVLLSMELRMGAAIPPAFVEDFTDTVNKRRFKEAYELAKEDPSFVARVLTAGMSRLQYGIEDAREASFSMLESVGRARSS